MNYFIKNIHINKLLHLQNFNIPIENAETPHLILTGKNGTGKTVLLNAIADFLENVRGDNNLDFLKIEDKIKRYRHYIENAEKDEDLSLYRKNLEFYNKQYDDFFSKVDIEINDIYKIQELIQKGGFIIAFYIASRTPKMLESVNPTRPNLRQKFKVKETATRQFLFFLSDLKIQEALARNEKQIDDADSIHQWFVELENLLKDIYQDKNLVLDFNYKDYSFKINTKGKSFKFTEMSDGFAAAIDIIADLILKMQGEDSLTYNYLKPGIVLIDEIETHLHLELQRLVLPMLTKLFPNIQFIVTTHSPFVLNSLENAVAYDLEHREIIDELTEYSYESLAEGYFGVKTDSSYMAMRLKSFKDLLEKDTLTNGDAAQLSRLVADFEKIPEAVSPAVVGEFLRLRTAYSDRINALK